MTTTNNAPVSFRLADDELELLRQYQEDGEKSLNLTAKRLLLSALGVDTKKPSLRRVNNVDINQIKELVDQAVSEKITEFTAVDNVDTLKQLINESITDGSIGDAIANSYTAMMGQFNGLLEELQALQKQVQELQSISPAPGRTTDNGQLTNEILTEPPKTDSENNSDTQLPPGDDLVEIKSDNSIILDDETSPKLDKPTITLHNGSSLVVSEKQEKILILLGLIPQTHNILTSQFLGSICKENLTTNKEELESLIGGKIDSKGSIIRKTAAVLRAAGFVLSGGESKGYKIIDPK
ncbi:MAG: hypothetical protein ACKO3K_10205 [Cuspidothrix sp.]